MSTMSDPARNAAAITPSDSTQLGSVRAFHVGVAGDVAVEMEGGGDITFKGCQAGMLYPYRVVKIKSTNTTATDIVALY